MSINVDEAAKSNTLQSFLTSLGVNAILLTIQVSAFVVLKHKLERIYSPRTYLPPVECVSCILTLYSLLMAARDRKRANELPKGPWRWLPAVLSAPTKDIVSTFATDSANIAEKFLFSDT
jgi:calcium permeable stress-gated cation channel